MANENILEVTALTKSFGGLVAVDDYYLSLAKSEIVGLIGPNGAGKTTVVNMLIRHRIADSWRDSIFGQLA